MADSNKSSSTAVIVIIAILLIAAGIFATLYFTGTIFGETEDINQQQQTNPSISEETVSQQADSSTPTVSSEMTEEEQKQAAQDEIAQQQSIAQQVDSSQQQTSTPSVIQQQQTSTPSVIQQQQTSTPSVIQQQQTSTPSVIQQQQTAQEVIAQQQSIAQQVDSLQQQQTSTPTTTVVQQPKSSYSIESDKTSSQQQQNIESSSTQQQQQQVSYASSYNILLDKTLSVLVYGSNALDDIYYKCTNATFNSANIYANSDLTVFLMKAQNNDWSFVTGTQFDINYNAGDVDNYNIIAKLSGDVSTTTIQSVYIYDTEETVGDVVWIDGSKCTVVTTTNSSLNGTFYITNLKFNSKYVHTNKGFNMFMMRGSDGVWSFCTRDQFFINWEAGDVDNYARTGKITDDLGIYDWGDNNGSVEVQDTCTSF